MDFVAVVDQAIALLRQRGRLTYRTLQWQFQLDAAALEDLKVELIEGQCLAIDERGTVLVWTGEAASLPAAAAVPAPAAVERPQQAPLAYTPSYLAEKILTSRSALEGERKQVTVLFADLKGSMELLADRDPEEARQLLDPVLERMMGAYEQAIAAGQRALTLAMASGDVGLHTLANLRLGQSYCDRADYRRAIDSLRQAVAFFDGAAPRERFGSPNLPAVVSRVCLTRCYAELGMFAEGRTLGDEGLRMAEAVAHPGSLMLASWGIGLLALRQGDLARALPVLERAVGICDEADLPVYFPGIAAALGAAYTLGRRLVDAVPLLMQAMAQSAATARAHVEALCHLALGEAYIRAGRLEEGHVLAQQALALAHERQERDNQTYVLSLLGDIATRRDPPEVEPAQAYYQQSLTLAETLGMRPLQAHCHRGLGMLYATTGQQEQARAALSTAIEMYRDMAMTFWLPETEAALAQVDA